MFKRKHVTKKVIAGGALVAAGAGYLTGILTAPKSGKDTRHDIAKSASKARTDGERQLKKLHSELNGLIKDGDAATKKARTKASKELKEALEKAKVAKDKSREILSALHDGDADDPNLQAVLDEVKHAKKNLVKYLKK
ncbi:MAG: YtxH domain-containing protein [Candidatus Saccharimonadales bacterium]